MSRLDQRKSKLVFTTCATISEKGTTSELLASAA